MKNTIATFICFAIFTTSLLAQRDETIFNRLDLTGAWGGAIASTNKFEDNFTLIRGGFGGLEFNKTFFIGWGGASARENIELDGKEEFDLKYNGLMLGVAPQSFRVLHPKVMLLMGTGELETARRDDSIWVIEPSAGVEVNVFRWFRLGADVGYRFVADVDTNTLADKDASSLFGQLTFKFGYSWGR